MPKSPPRPRRAVHDRTPSAPVPPVSPQEILVDVWYQLSLQTHVEFLIEHLTDAERRALIYQVGLDSPYPFQFQIGQRVHHAGQLATGIITQRVYTERAIMPEIYQYWVQMPSGEPQLCYEADLEAATEEHKP
jgi:hypothetical protein